MTKYVCYFTLVSKKMSTTVPDIGSVKDGFWINSSGDFTNASDCVLWIAPASIEYVQKMNEDQS